MGNTPSHTNTTEDRQRNQAVLERLNEQIARNNDHNLQGILFSVSIIFNQFFIF